MHTYIPGNFICKFSSSVQSVYFDSRTRPGKSLFKIMTIEFKDYEEFLLRTDIRTPWDALSLLENTENNYQALYFRLRKEKMRACRKAYLSMFDSQVKMYRSCEFELRKQGLIENADAYRKARLESLHRILELRQFSKKG